MSPDEVALKIQEATCKATQLAILTGTHESHSTFDGLHVGCMAILGAIEPTALMASKKPGQFATQEAMMFSAVLAARAPTEITKEGMITVEFGPHIIFEALEICEKIFGKSIDSYLDKGMVEAARRCGAGSTIPLEELMQKRSVAHELSKTLQ